MAKKKSTLSRALQNAQDQQHRAQKAAAKRLTQQQKQPKHLQPKKPHQPLPSTVRGKTRNRSENTLAKSQEKREDGYHGSPDVDSEAAPVDPITTQETNPPQPSPAALLAQPNNLKSPDQETNLESQVTADLKTAPNLVAQNDQPKSRTKPRLSMVSRHDQVLLVGEGNFSFAVSLLVEYSHPGSLITASTIDTKETVLKKYPDSETILQLLEEHKVTILFELDGCKLNEDKRIKKSKIKFDKVIFNFPHVGGSEPDQDRNVRANQILILRFLRSVSTLLFQPDGWPFGQDEASKTKRPKPSTKNRKKLKSHLRRPSSPSDPDESGRFGSVQESDAELDLYVRKPGTVSITAGTCPPYSFWDVPALAKNGNILAPTILYPTHPNLRQQGEQPVYKLVRSFDFEKSINTNGSQTYQHRQTNGFKHSQKDTRPGNPRTWEFELLVP